MVKQGLLILLFAVFSQPFFSQPPELANYPTAVGKITALEQYIEKCLVLENYNEAKRASLQALQLSVNTKIDTLILRNLYNTGFSYKNLSNFDSAIYYFNRLLTHGAKITARLLVKTQLNLASSYENTGKMDSVASIMKRLESNLFFQTDSLSTENIKYLMFRGVLREDKGNYEKALADYMRALRISQVIKETTLITDNLVNIGAFYFNLEKYPKCLEYYEQAQVSFTQSAKTESLQACTSFRTMGIAYERIGKKQLGIEYANKAIVIAKKLKINKLLVFCYTGIATIYLERKDYQHAEDYYLQCLDLLKNTNLKFNKLSIYGQLGLVNFELKKFDVAKHYFEMAHEIAIQVGRKSSISASYKDLSKTEAARGNFSKAYEYQQLYASYRDSINAETSNKNIAEMEAKYQTEKKQQEIALLDAQNNAQRLKLRNQKWVVYSLLVGFGLIVIIVGLLWKSYRTKQLVNKELNEKNEELNTLIEKVSENNEELTVLNERLNEANQSKTKLFSIISHDLRSPVVSLFQYLKLRENNFLQLDESAKQAYNKTIIQSAENLSEVMEDLLIWAKSQMEQFELSPEKITLKNVFEEVVLMHSIPANQKGISIKLECFPDLSFVTDANFFKVILRNLVSNAIKYSPDNERVTISATLNSNNLEVSIKNFGISITNEQISNLFSWDSIKSSATGMGLRLTRDFIAKLDGTLEVKTEPDISTEFILKLPPLF